MERGKSGLILMGDLPKGENGLIIMGDLPRKNYGLIVMGDLPILNFKRNYLTSRNEAVMVHNSYSFP